MHLLTKKIQEKATKQYKLGSDLEKQNVVAKFFNPTGAGTWYVMEGEKQNNNDWVFYGVAEIQDKEWGEFSLFELEDFRGVFGLGIERDRNFQGTYQEIK